MTDRPAFGLDPNTIVQLVPVPPGFVCFHEIEHPDLEPVDPNPPIRSSRWRWSGPTTGRPAWSRSRRASFTRTSIWAAAGCVSA
jgi:hypothetical protein